MVDRRIAHALAELDPTVRALLDLSLRRGLSDGALGDMAGAYPADIARWRREALEEIATEAGLEGDELQTRLLAVSDEHWLGEQPVRLRVPRAAAVGAALVAAAAIAVVVVLAAGGGSSAPEDASTAPTSAPGAPGEAGEPESASSEANTERSGGRAGVALAPLRGNRAKGRVTVRLRRTPGRRSIEARLLGLPKPSGRYELWLYDSRTRARRLGHLDAGTGRIRARVPRRAGRYRSLDLSREPRPADARHSRRSLFRTRLRRVLEPRAATGSQR